MPMKINDKGIVVPADQAASGEAQKPAAK